MDYVVLGWGSWENYGYKRWLDLLPDRNRVYFGGTMTAKQQRESGVEALPISGFDPAIAGQSVWIVSSPYWLPAVFASPPRFLVVLLEPCPEGANPSLWAKYGALLAAKADLVGTRSEKLYLEQTLCRESVLLLRSDDSRTYGVVRKGSTVLFLNDCEVLWNQALSALGREPDWARQQWKIRAEYYKSISRVLSTQPVVFYLTASYLYMLGDAEASQYLARSFELMLQQNYTDILHSHVRFFSAITAKGGDLETALTQYEITAVTADEKQNAAVMRHLLATGQNKLLEAEIYRVNEDEAAAIRLLEGLPLAEGGRLLLQHYIATYQWEKALLQYEMLEDNRELDRTGDDAGGSGTAASELLRMRSILQLLEGRRHDSLRCVLELHRLGEEAWPLLEELSELEEAMYQWQKEG